METKKELYSIHQCESVEDFKELQRQRYKRWYAQNSEKKREYTKNYYRKYLSKEARESNCNWDCK